MTFDEWLEEEWQQDKNYANNDVLKQLWRDSYITSMAWLRAAYERGYDAGQEDERNIGHRGPG